jgi:hypothetical protein
MLFKRKIVVFLITILLAGTPVGSPTSADTNQERARPKPIKRRPLPNKPRQPRGDETQAGAARRAAPLFWVERGRIEALDLYHGPGGRAGAPNPAGRFKLISRINEGTSKKLLVEDERGRKWTVKFGPEARPETAATRLIWAMGYHADETYFVKRARILDAGGAGRGGKSFDVRDVRFERRWDGFKGAGNWSWVENPFVGTRELAGLKVLMALLNNWDLKRSNNTVLCPERGGGRCVYFVSDLGATFGKTGSPWRKVFFFADPPAGSKGKAADYARQSFIEETERGEVDFNYKGKNPEALEGVSVESARWMGERLARLSDRQLADAFRASGFGSRETAIYTRALRQRIRQLRKLE